MKKVKAFILMFVFFVTITASYAGANAWIGDRYENEEIAFQSIMREMREEQGFEYESYTFEKDALYKTDGELSGYCYEFTLDGQRDGFVLMVKVIVDNETFYEVTEIFPDSISPFHNNTGVNIYPTFVKYISYVDGIYFDLTTNLEVTAEYVLTLEEKGFGFSGDPGTYTSWTERVDYATRTIQKDEIAIGLPGITYGSTLGSNGCAVIAGNNVITYWTVYKPNLIPGYSVGQFILGSYWWTGNTYTAGDVSNELYVRMGTNTIWPGTSIQQFKNGIVSYASAFGGYSATFRSAMTNNQYDMSKMLAEFAAGRPIVLFMDPQYNLTGDIFNYNGPDGPYNMFAHANYLGSHAMVACGRHIYTWYNAAGGVVRQISFLRAAPGFTYLSMGYIRLNEGSLSIDEALSVEII